MEKRRSKSMVGEMIKKYKWNLLLQTVVFGILMAVLLVWEPIFLKKVFEIIEQRKAESLVICGGAAGIALVALFCMGYLNNTYLDMERWKIIYQECEEALRALPTLCYDKINYHFSEGGIFERIFTLGQAKVSIVFNMAAIGIYVTAGAFLIGSISKTCLFFLIMIVGMLAAQMLLLWIRSILSVKYERKYRLSEEKSNMGGKHIMNDLPFIMMNGLEQEEIERFAVIRSSVFGILEKQKLWEAFFQAIDTCLTVFVKVSLAFWIFPMAMGSGFVTAAFAVIDKLKMVLNAVAEYFVGMKKMKVAVERYEEMQIYIQEPRLEPIDREALITVSNAALKVEDKVIFENRSMEIKAGEKVAVIGPNGCGKSSVLKVLAGEYHLTEGTVREQRDCRIAYIPAKANLFAGTCRENIMMARRTQQDSAQEISDFWFCRDFLEQQIDRISGGQQQRVNIARGLYGGVELVLADEPTSHLDQETACEVMKYLVEHTNTCVVITHDKSLLTLFDRVIEWERNE